MIHNHRTTYAPDETVVFALLSGGMTGGDELAEMVRDFLDVGLLPADIADVLRNSPRFGRDVAAIDVAYRADAALLIAQVESFLATRT